MGEEHAFSGEAAQDLGHKLKKDLGPGFDLYGQGTRPLAGPKLIGPHGRRRVVLCRSWSAGG